MLVQKYQLRLRTASETFIQQNYISNTDNFLIYFKGDQGLTQTLTIPLNKLIENMYECQLELVDVGNLSLVHIKLDANNVRWKLNSIELEYEKNISNFPIHRWLDSSQSFNVLLNQGPIQLASIYTIIVRTGTISSSTQLDMHLALIGDGASTLPFYLNSNSNLIHSTNNHLFQSGSKNFFYISSFYSIDIGQLFHIQIWCNSIDKLPYYCESIEVINNFNDKKYFFLVNHWFGPNLEEYLSVPLINRNEESNMFTISIKTIDISKSDDEHLVLIYIEFANGKSYEEALHSSETHQIPFQKNNIDFFSVTFDNVNDNEVTSYD
ncbi:unnamed protein product [Adineta steineri]|uniref:PLAT domain-containing protein n=3 Tax=Adineta steineri TaxID=433720 RepID=A0A814MS41_9BILA|nr:unnamed protein product [Adineta steineri]